VNGNGGTLFTFKHDYMKIHWIMEGKLHAFLIPSLCAVQYQAWRNGLNGETAYDTCLLRCFGPTVDPSMMVQPKCLYHCLEPNRIVCSQSLY